MITECKVMGPTVTDKDGVVTKRSTMVITLDGGTRITIIPPDQYPDKDKQKEILDELYSIEIGAARRRRTEKTA